MGEQAQRRLVRGVDDLDFYIGDEAVEKPNYATKVGEGKEAGPLFVQRDVNES